MAASCGQGVGKSHRTPLKHGLLNALLGREAGIFAVCPHTVHARACPWHIIDMNAGDGSCHPGHGLLSSPAVITRHAGFVRTRSVPARVTLIERAEATFRRLVGNVMDQEDIEFLHMDARDYRVPITHTHQAVFVHSDPNSLADWCLTPGFIGSFSETTTMLGTLGCNVGGLKRLPASERLGWFEHVDDVVRSMPRYHDAVLISLDSDPAQWAYLVRVPSAWTARVMDEARRVSSWVGLKVSMASLRRGAEDFRRLERELFLTHAERRTDGQTETR